MLQRILRSVLMLVVACMFGVTSVMAQTSTIQGTVTDSETSETLPGVNVFIQSLNKGAATNSSGEYQIEEVPYGTYEIRLSYVGYNTKTVSVTVDEPTETVDLTMVSSVQRLDDVVVTAFGVEREQRSLGYSSQEVSAEELSQNPEVNFVNSLQGKVAGVNITQGSGAVGSSSRIVLRGVSSLTGENQPLFIIDGVYVDNSNFDQAGEFGGVDYGNAAMDINSNNIKSISVLKGPNAAALYGSRASNGVIIIETKDGIRAQEGIGVDVNSTVRVSDVAILPDMQNQYGQGSGGEFEYVDGAGGGVNDGTDESWGPPLNGQEKVQWWTNGETAPWVAHPDNVRSYFERGYVVNNNVALAGNYGRTNFRLSATNTFENGTIPNSKLQSNNFSLNAGVDLTEDFRAEGRVSYTQMIGDNRPQLGYSAENPMQQLTQWFGRQVDMDRLREYTQEDGSPRNWNYNYHDNVYWQQYKNTNQQQRDRVIGNINLEYDITNWFNLQGTIGTDFYRDSREEVIAMTTLNDPLGDYRQDNYFVNQWRSNITAHVDRQLTGSIDVDARVGVEHFKRDFRRTYGRAPSLIVPGVYTLSNSAIRPEVESRTAEKATNSVFGSATVGYNDYLYLDLTGRNDWSSTLPEDNNSYFYPSASLSFIFSDAFDLGLDWLSFGKVRASWTRVGSDTDPYALVPYFQNEGVFGNVPQYTVDNTLANANLEPEFTTSIEFGGELRFVDDRIGIDLTYYDSDRSNQIVPVQVSAASGYTSKYVNVGEVSNKGVEATLNLTPVLRSDFQWDVTVNWSKNNNEVVSLTEGLDTYIHYDTWDATIESRPGEEYGSIYGYGFLRDDQGNIVVDGDGIPITDTSEKKNLGSYQADWSGSIYNSISYQNFDLSFLIDIRQGGTLNSVTYMFGRYTGILEETLEGRDGSYVFDGERWADGAVKQDGSPNDIQVGAESFNKGTFFGNAESHTFDASYVKLRELRLGYSIPSQTLGNLPFRNVDLSLVGRNLWIIDKNVPHIDPETAFNTGNVQGLESNQIPSVRSFGFSVNLGF